MGRTGDGGTATKRYGPGWAVTAAFIGPGTVTTMTVAGARFGYALLWAVVLSVLVAIILQEMAGRVAIARRQGFGSVLRETFQGRARVAMTLLVIGAIFVGNAAFQIGNIAGAGLGLGIMIGGPPLLLAILVADVAFLALWFAAHERLDGALRIGVGIMGVAFIVTVFLAPIDWIDVLRGLTPLVPAGAAILVLGTIGTTVVPYNIFLHAALVKEIGWRATDAFLMRRDTIFAITVGGIITAAILLTSGALLEGTTVSDARTMAVQLRPLLGTFASKAFGAGLFLAGLTSAITAPFAAAYAVTEVVGGAWNEGGIRGHRFRTIWITVLGVGLAPQVASLFVDVDVLGLIVLAQALNGLILPLLAITLLVVANQREMGPLRNRLTTNLLGGLACLIATGLGIRLLVQAVDSLGGG